MIPYQTITITKRHATVLSGQLPTEKHGDTKKAFIDLKFLLLLERSEVDDWVRPVDGILHPANECIFTEAGDLVLPSLDLKGRIRDNLKGALTIFAAGAEPMEFGDAHIVGTVSKLEFQTGGHGKLTLQLRFDPGIMLEEVVDIIERGECSFEFTEYADNGAATNKDQAELAV